MKILVCVKQVPDSTMRIRVGADAKNIVTDGMTWAISPYDEYAIEMALERKDADPSTSVSVVTVGPARAKDALRAALAMGCDDATYVSAEESAAPLAVARALARFVAQKQPDLVLCGKQASDDDQGFVGPALATLLGWPHVAQITKFAQYPDGGVELWREVEGGHEVWSASGPVLATAQKSEKEPRYPSLPGIMKAKKKEIPELALASLGGDLPAPAAEVRGLEPPLQRGGGRILKPDGDTTRVAAELVRLLRDEAKVL